MLYGPVLVFSSKLRSQLNLMIFESFREKLIVIIRNMNNVRIIFYSNFTTKR